MNTHYYAVIMAGGIGSRFWPVSTTRHPKQFHDMLGTGKSLLQATYDRLSGFVPAEQVQVLTNARYTDQVLEQIPGMKRNQVVPEPAMRNTAPCILWSAMRIAQKDPEAIMLVAPSDHWIEDEASFARDVLACMQRCEEEDVLVTLGIPPTSPNTGYGYIETDLEDDRPIKKVSQFKEKPDEATAKEFLASGNYYWNAGIFIWSVRSILSAFQKYMPGMYKLFEEGNPVYNGPDEMKFIHVQYPQAENISIDYGILERADNVWVKPANFDWNDLGTWGALHEKLTDCTEENAVVRAIDHIQGGKGNMVYTQKEKLVVIDGLDDFIVVDKDDVLLIFPKAKQQQIKQLLASVNDRFGEQYS